MFYDRDTMDMLLESSYRTFRYLFRQGKKFSIVIWNNNDWNHPLPQETMKAHPEHILLDINSQEIERSEILEDGSVLLRLIFGETHYEKVILPKDIIAILDGSGRAIHSNNFKDVAKEELLDSVFSLNDLYETLLASGVEDENIIKSMEAFGL